MSKTRRLAAPALAAILCTGVAIADDHSQQTFDGLVLVPDSKVDAAYRHPDADFSGYERVMLLEPQVSFIKNFARDLRREQGIRASARDLDRIKGRMAELFLEVFTQALEDGGYAIAEEAADDVLLLRPMIVDLDISAPDIPTPGRSRTYVTSAGAVSLFIELYDSATGQILARAVDRKRARDYHQFRWASAASNRQEARRALKAWAEMLVEGLNEARGQ